MRAYIRSKYCLIVLLLTAAVPVLAEERPYLCELGLQAGAGYYVGDATSHIFQNVRETYGLHFRYKFTKRWAIQAKGLTQRITGNNYAFDASRRLVKQNTYWQNRLINVDVMAECNFLRFGAKNKYDKTLYPYTPYIFLGIGAAMYGSEMNRFDRVAAYFPFGIGFKWKFYDWMGLNIAWQHNLYFADNLETGANLDNTYKLNGSNIMNFDLTGQLTLGIVFEFGKAKKICRICNSD